MYEKKSSFNFTYFEPSHGLGPKFENVFSFLNIKHENLKLVNPRKGFRQYRTRQVTGHCHLPKFSSAQWSCTDADRERQTILKKCKQN